MSDQGGFIDLRVGHGAQGVGDDSVWPSFTDVMTVIVMIFLMALVVIMIRNFELDRELLATISDREAAQNLSEDLARAKSELESSLASRETTLEETRTTLENTISSLALTQEERDELQLRLQQELERISQLSLDQDRLEAELGTLIELRKELESANVKLTEESRGQRVEIERLLASEQTLTARINALSEKLGKLELTSSAEISSLTQEKQTLGQKLDTVSLQLTQIRLLLDEAQLENRDLNAEIESLVAQVASAEENYAIAEEEIEALTELIRLREAENAALQLEASSTLANFRSLQEEYDSLDEKYRDLIRPARSEAGKFVVEVWIEKLDSEFVYQVRQPDDAEPRFVDFDALNQELAELKSAKGQALYTKIIIPEDSNLSHNEAWRFTESILTQYDYYYQPQQ